MAEKLSYGAKIGYDARVGAGLSRGVKKGSNAIFNQSWANAFPAPRATLDLDFANDRGFVRGVGQGRSMDAVTFTRASNGTFVKPDGTLSQHSNQGALGNNLLTFPQDFDNAAWVKSTSTVIANAEIAPDGTLTADKIINGTSGGLVASFINQNNGAILPNTTGVFSVYAKAGELNIIALGADNYDDGFSGVGQRVWFNLLDETIFGSPSAAGATGSISSVGNGWYRCSIVFNTLTTVRTGFFRCFLARTNGSLNTTQNESGLFIWGAQLELGSTATEYFPTNINVPRFDWASTVVLANKNLANNTENITNVSGTTINLNTTTAPDGTLTAEKIIPTSGAATTHYASGGYNMPAGGIYTISCYAKKEEYSGFRIILNSAAGRYVFYRFDVNTGTYTGATPASTVPTLIGTPTVDDVGSGWYRCRVTIDNNSTGFSYNFLLGATSSSTDEARDYSGDGTSGLYVWGTQVELGDTLTSYEAVAQTTSTTPLLANPTSNGLLIEETRTNRILWCRDATKVGTNLVSYSEQFDNAFWVKPGLLAFGSGSVANTTETTDPLGWNTADLIVENTASNVIHGVNSPVGVPVSAVGGVYVASIYAKNPTVNGRRYLQITYSSAGFGTTQYATFDLQDGVVSGSATTVGTPVMTDVGDGWYRCSVAVTAISTSSAQIFYILSDVATGRAPTYPGNGTSGVYIWGAQVEETFLGNYAATTTAPIIGWRNINVTVAKNQTGIDGVANACSSLTATSANGACVQTINLVSGLRTASVYLKRITGTGNIQVTLDGTTYSTVDLSTSEWRRIVLSGTVTIPAVGIRIVTSGDAVAMDFGQVEDGAFATSPIMTTNATAGVARAAEATAIDLTNSMSILDYQSGTCLVNFKPYIVPLTTVGAISIISVGGTNGYFNFYNSTGSRFGLTAAGDNANAAAVSITALTDNIIAASWASTGIKRSSNIGGFDQRFVNFVPFQPQTPSAVQNFQRLAALNSTTKRVIYYPFQVSITELQTLTGGAT